MTTSACWRGVDADGKELFIQALRNAPSHSISEPDVAETARLAHEQRLEHALLLIAGSPTRAAVSGEGQQRAYLDGGTLRSQLATIAESVDRQQANAQAEAKTHARAAIAAHAATQKALTPWPSALKQNRPSDMRRRTQHWRRRVTGFARRESRLTRRFWPGRRCRRLAGSFGSAPSA